MLMWILLNTLFWVIYTYKFKKLYSSFPSLGSVLVCVKHNCFLKLITYSEYWV